MAFFAVANIKSVPLMRTSKVVADLDRLLGSWLKGKGAVIGLSEITPRTYKTAVKAAAVRHGFGVYGALEENPILWDLRRFEYYPAGGRGRFTMHEGRRLVTPHRTYVWIALREVGTANVFIFVATHYVSGAWARAFRSFKAWRRGMWQDAWNDQNEFVDSMTDKGFAVVNVGDYNKGNFEPFSVGQVELLGSTAGIMHVSWVDGRYVKGDYVGTPVDRLNGSKNGGPLNTDHPAWGREVRLSRVA